MDTHETGDYRERSALSDSERVLSAEVNHRVRNLLQIVVAISNQTLRTSADLPTFEQAFRGRLSGLSRAYDLVAQKCWGAVRMEEIVRHQLSAFRADDRYAADGPDITLTAEAALTLASVLYELASNSAQHGAWSSEHGRVEVSWRLLEQLEGRGTAAIEWKESGGPAVTSPTHTGVGAAVVNEQLAHELGGMGAIEFGPHGIHATLAVPGAAINL